MATTLRTRVGNECPLFEFARPGDFDRTIIEFGEASQNIRHPSEQSEIEPYCEARYQRALVFQHRGKDNLALEDFAAAISMWLRSQGNPGKKKSSDKLKKCIRDAHVGRGQIYMSWRGRAERMRREVSQLKVIHQNQPLGTITLSLGADVAVPGTHPEKALQGAVWAVRQAKRKGRNKVVVASACRQLGGQEA